MTTIKNTTKKAAAIIACLTYDLGDIYSAYKRPGETNIKAYEAIKERACNTPGYNNDLHVCGAGSHNFSTIYTYTDESGKTYAIKDTRDNIYRVELA